MATNRGLTIKEAARFFSECVCREIRALDPPWRVTVVHSLAGINPKSLKTASFSFPPPLIVSSPNPRDALKALAYYAVGAFQQQCPSRGEELLFYAGKGHDTQAPIPVAAAVDLANDRWLFSFTYVAESQPKPPDPVFSPVERIVTVTISHKDPVRVPELLSYPFILKVEVEEFSPACGTFVRALADLGAPDGKRRSGYIRLGDDTLQFFELSAGKAQVTLSNYPPVAPARVLRSRLAPLQESSRNAARSYWWNVLAATRLAPTKPPVSGSKGRSPDQKKSRGPSARLTGLFGS